MERGRLSNVVSEQQLSLSGLMDETQAIRIGKLLGVKAIVVGEVGQYSVSQRHTDTTYFPLILYGKTTNIPIQGKQWEESFVSISLRIIDIETSQLVYSGSGQYDRGLQNPPQQLAEFILRDIIARWIRDPDQPQLTKEAKDNTERQDTEPNDSSVIKKTIAWPGRMFKATKKLFQPTKNEETQKEYIKEAVTWTEKSNESVRSKNWSEVIRTSSAAIIIDPTYPVAYVNRSWAYLEKGFLNEAFADCQKALELDGVNTAAHNNMGLFYLRTGQPDKAKSDFETACNGGLEVGCNNFKIITGYRPSEKFEFFLNKAKEAFNKQDWDGVIKYTSEIVTSESQKEIVLAVRAGAYAYKGLLKEALDDCDEAIKINPDSALPYNNKAFVLELMGKHKEALLNYEFACNLKMPLGCDNVKRLTSSMKKQ